MPSQTKSHCRFHGTIICWFVQVLAGALTDLKEAGVEGPLFEKVQMKNINPKSVTMGQLYGESDRATQEWKDGVLGLTFRQLASDPCQDRKWYGVPSTLYVCTTFVFFCALLLPCCLAFTRMNRCHKRVLS